MRTSVPVPVPNVQIFLILNKKINFACWICSAPSTPLEIAVDYYTNDYENAEPPRVTSLQGTLPIRTFTDFGEEDYFVADERGYESLVHHLVNQSLNIDAIKLNQVYISP